MPVPPWYALFAEVDDEEVMDEAEMRRNVARLSSLLVLALTL